MKERFAPRAVKFEKVHDDVRRQLFTAAVRSAVKELREDLARRVLQGLKIDDPVLSKQFNQRVEDRAARAKDRQKIRDDMDRQRQSATAPATTPGTPEPGNAPASATQPAAGH